MNGTMRCVFLNGTVGVGKTSVAEASAIQLSGTGVPSAAIDLDSLRLAWPAPSEDPFQHGLELANQRSARTENTVVSTDGLDLQQVTASVVQLARDFKPRSDPRSVGGT